MKKKYGGKYVSEQRFGDGDVILATNTETGEETALKRFPAGQSAAIQEAEIWKKVYPDEFRETFAESEFDFVARKWIVGETLTDYVKRNGNLSEKKALGIAKELSEELWKIYRETGLVHGDIKPDNVIVFDGGVRLIDFESSCRENIGDVLKDKNRRRTIKFISPGFSAPEKMKGITSEKSDFYSLGMLIVYMMTGDTVKSACEATPETKKIIDKCLCVDMENRIGSIETLVQETGSALDEAEERPPQKNGEKHAGILFQRKQFGYRRLILYVPDNVSFSVELASAFVSGGLKAGIYEMCDFGDGIVRFYVRNDSANDENPLCEIACEGNTLYGEKENVFVSTKKLSAEEELGVDAMRDFMVRCYGEFDVTIVCDSLMRSMENRAQLMRFSDYVVLPICPDADVFEETVKKYKSMFAEYSIPEKRLLAVAWEYKKGESAEETMLAKVASGTYLGRIETDGLRHKSKNIDGVFYNEIMPENIAEQYRRVVQKIMTA